MPRTSPLLQLAVDTLSLDDAMRLVERVYPHFDILEVGTPLIIEEGLAPVEQLKRRFGDKQCLADLKIMDAGRLEASSGFRRGADIVTVLGAADDETIRGALEAAAEAGGRLMADLINVADPVHRARELVDLGVHILCLHTAYDLRDRGIDPLGELHGVRPVVSCPLAIAGGIALSQAREAVARGADIVIVGGGISNQPDPAAAAAAILASIREPDP